MRWGRSWRGKVITGLSLQPCSEFSDPHFLPTNGAGGGRNNHLLSICTAGTLIKVVCELSHLFFQL